MGLPLLNHTPAPPFHRLCCHVILARSPAGEGESGACGLILEVLRQDAAGIAGGDLVRLGVDVQQGTEVGVAGLIVGSDGAVVGVGVLEVVLFGQRPDRILGRDGAEPLELLMVRLTSARECRCHTQFAPNSTTYGLPCLSFPKSVCQTRPPRVSRYSRMMKSSMDALDKACWGAVRPRALGQQGSDTYRRRNAGHATPPVNVRPSSPHQSEIVGTLQDGHGGIRTPLIPKWCLCHISGAGAKEDGR